MTPDQAMRRIDTLLSHVWMVRAFVKHSDEAEDDEELRDVHHALYDYMLALGGPLTSGDTAAYLRLATKKFSKLKKTTELFLQLQPAVSTHTNFQMAGQSLKAAVDEIGDVLEQAKR